MLLNVIINLLIIKEIKFFFTILKLILKKYKKKDFLKYNNIMNFLLN